MMIYLVQSERSFRLRVENPSGISEEQSFRFQPVLHSNEIVISLGQDHAADSERGDSNQRSLHNCRIARSSWRRRPRLWSQRDKNEQLIWPLLLIYTVLIGPVPLLGWFAL
jgi:hypothetical protein